MSDSGGGIPQLIASAGPPPKASLSEMYEVDPGRGRSEDVSKGGVTEAFLRKQSIITVVVVFSMITALVLGCWYTESLSQKLAVVVNVGSLSNPFSFSHSEPYSSHSPSISSVAEDARSSSVPDYQWMSKASKRSISSVEAEERSAGDNGSAKEEGSSQQIFTSIDLSDATNHETLARLYHSSKVFSLNYNEMLRKFKIYIYPAQNESTYEYSLFDGSEQAEDVNCTEAFFVKSLFGSKFTTDSPEEAILFLVPVSIDALWRAPGIGPSKVGGSLRRYVQKLRENYPYWQRTLGVDHFYVSCHGYEADGDRNFLELNKNAVQVACSPLQRTQDFFPHKDIVMPQYRSVSAQKSIALEGLRKGKALRKNLAYYAGPIEGDPAINSVYEAWKADPSFVLETGNREPSSYYNGLATSRFCLSLSPHDTLSIVDSLRFGCVPVVISDGRFYDLPFQDVLNWHEFAVVLSQKGIAKVKSILMAISVEQYQRMQFLGQQASKHMEWNTPPWPYDAFHMTMYELWLRRHSIRYTRRSNQ